MIGLLVLAEGPMMWTVLQRPTWIVVRPPDRPPTPSTPESLPAIARDYARLFGRDLPCALIEKVGLSC